MKKILITYPIPKEGIKELHSRYDVIYPSERAFSKEDILKHIKDADALLSIFSIPVDADIIKAGENLKVISNYGVGYNNIDLSEAKKHNISVCNTPQSVCRPTAELCLSLMLAAVRRVAECNHRIRTDSDFKWGVMENLGHSLYGKTLGIIGMGSIGKELARLCSVFGMKIVYHNRHRLDDETEKRYNAEYCELDNLLSVSDVVSIHTPLNDDTFHLIGSRELEIMKPTAYLINTARGAVIDENALIESLRKEKIAGAALDVFETEPNINKEFFKLNNVVIVPHIGTATIDSRISMGREASQNIIAYFEGSPQNIVC